jgi:hypothetical protein
LKRSKRTDGPPRDEPSVRGWALRRRVLGEAFHRRSLERYRHSELWRPMLDLASRTCWGELWRRPGLSLKQRCLINVAVMTALRPPHEIGVFVPAIGEAVPGYAFDVWYGMLFPAGTPPAIVAKANEELGRILASAATAERFAALGLEPLASSAAEFAALIAREIPRWRKVVAAAGIRPN